MISKSMSKLPYHDAIDELDADRKPISPGPLERQSRGQSVEMVEASLAVGEPLAWLGQDDVDVEPATLSLTPRR